MRSPEQKRTTKLDKKAKMGILLGYEEVGYRILINNRVIVTPHVDFVEKGVKYIGLDDEIPNKTNKDHVSNDRLESSSENSNEDEQIDLNEYENEQLNAKEYESEHSDLNEKENRIKNKNLEV